MTVLAHQRPYRQVRAKSAFTPRQTAGQHNVASKFQPHTLALLFHCLPDFLQAALFKGCGGIT